MEAIAKLSPRVTASTATKLFRSVSGTKGRTQVMAYAGYVARIPAFLLDCLFFDSIPRNTECTWR